jgi:lysyl-tRNA synthetase class 2
LPLKKSNLWLRAKIFQAVRQFFVEHDYLEVDTPNIIPAPAPEAHIEAINAGEGFLHTSPELCMKRLLSAGHQKIFQICRCYREGERGDLHLPEFTMLEWYRTGIDYTDLMTECETMIRFVTSEIRADKKIKHKGVLINLEQPWDRITVKKAFSIYTQFTMKEAVETDLFNELMATEIEPSLAKDRPVFLYDYPAGLASLSRIKKDDPEVAERFELYIGGLELANAFTELTDPGEQKNRFNRENTLRKSLMKKTYPSPDRFLQDLEHMPPAAGIALGLDRLVLLYSGDRKIDHVVSFTPEEL